MKAYRLITTLAVTLIVGGIGASKASAYMQDNYGFLCGQLTGLPGVLAKVHFFAQANCQIKPGTTNTCAGNGACNINPPSGGASVGRCTQTPSGCQCLAPK